VAAARLLFRERGYGATTMEAIAEKAGVGVATVYAAFGSKRGLLKGMRRAMLAESEIPLLLEQIRAEPDPAGKLGLQARLVRQQMEHSYDVIAAHREGSRTDPDVATEHREVLDSRAAVFDEIARSIEPSLAPSVDVGTATDLLWVLANEELYRELVVERGWSNDRFETWLADTLRFQLLGR
jgi:TetR/AcrR family transcriptional regulator, regulator of cefoperazone and chloramphenicol sensitivity